MNNIRQLTLKGVIKTVKKADIPSRRKKKDAIYDKEGNMYCPHCQVKIEDSEQLTKWRYGTYDGEYWFKHICKNCGHYIMTYRNHQFNVIKKNIKEEESANE